MNGVDTKVLRCNSALGYSSSGIFHTLQAISRRRRAIDIIMVVARGQARRIIKFLTKAKISTSVYDNTATGAK